MTQNPPPRGSFWHQALANFAPKNVIKACQFTVDEETFLLAATVDNLLAITNYYFARTPKTIAATVIAPTCRLQGEIIIASGVRVLSSARTVLFVSANANCRLLSFARPVFLFLCAAIASYCFNPTTSLRRSQLQIDKSFNSCYNDFHDSFYSYVLMFFSASSADLGRNCLLGRSRQKLSIVVF